MYLRKFATDSSRGLIRLSPPAIPERPELTNSSPGNTGPPNAFLITSFVFFWDSQRTLCLTEAPNSRLKFGRLLWNDWVCRSALTSGYHPTG
ncbi:hypothetical protein NFI96_026091 [Prochilodus magdalenae]|nr:hypothetical protein NFI96_026091 [Prochilodus magdalenae]